MTPMIHTVTLPNLGTLPYVAQGDPSGVPVLLLHGTTDSWRSFEAVLPHLPTSMHAIALTQRGHGDATRPVTGYAPRISPPTWQRSWIPFSLDQRLLSAILWAAPSPSALRWTIPTAPWGWC